jgi:PAS domain S-box-containing protein
VNDALVRNLAELSPMLPALLDALGYSGIALTVIADRGNGLERWFTNEPMARLLGYTLDEFLALKPIDMLVPEQHAFATQLSDGFRRGQTVPTSLEFVAQHKDGRPLPIDVAVGSFRMSEGVVYVSICRDVGTQPSQVSLLEADRVALVGALSAGFAHEINNPLTSVLLNLRSLRKQLTANLPETAQALSLRCLDDITTGAERIASNVRALQTLTTRADTQSIDLATVVASSLRLAAPTLEPRAQVNRQIVPVRGVTGEESRIGQAVLAMLLFSGSGFEAASATTTNRPTIVVAVEDRGEHVVVEVSDNGRDLTGEEAKRAFDPFFRSTSRGAGVGVGLGVARSVAAALGGAVTLVPRPGGGAVITMSLPAAR